MTTMMIIVILITLIVTAFATSTVFASYAATPSPRRCHSSASYAAPSPRRCHRAGADTVFRQERQIVQPSGRGVHVRVYVRPRLSRGKLFSPSPRNTKNPRDSTFSVKSRGGSRSGLQSRRSPN